MTAGLQQQIKTDKRLLRVARKLTDKGFRVLRCKVHETYDYTGTAIRIHCAEDYSTILGIFAELPPDWHIETDGPQDGEQYTHSVLTDYLPHIIDGDGDGDGDERKYQLTITISNLDTWLDNLDNEGTRAVLTLAGYPAGPIKHIPEAI